MDVEGDVLEKTVLLPIKSFADLEATAEEKLEASGLNLEISDAKKLLVTSVVYRSKAHRAGLDFYYEITDVFVSTHPPSKYLFFIPALLLLIFVVVSQKMRARKE